MTLLHLIRWLLRRLAWAVVLLGVLAAAALGEHVFGGEPGFLLVAIVVALIVIAVQLSRIARRTS